METTEIGNISQIWLKGYELSQGGFSDLSILRFIAKLSWKHFFFSVFTLSVTGSLIARCDWRPLLQTHKTQTLHVTQWKHPHVAVIFCRHFRNISAIDCLQDCVNHWDILFLPLDALRLFVIISRQGGNSWISRPSTVQQSFEAAFKPAQTLLI